MECESKIYLKRTTCKEKQKRAADRPGHFSHIFFFLGYLPENDETFYSCLLKTCARSSEPSTLAWRLSEHSDTNQVSMNPHSRVKASSISMCKHSHWRQDLSTETDFEQIAWVINMDISSRPKPKKKEERKMLTSFDIFNEGPFVIGKPSLDWTREIHLFLSFFICSFLLCDSNKGENEIKRAVLCNVEGEGGAFFDPLASY